MEETGMIKSFLSLRESYAYINAILQQRKSLVEIYWAYFGFLPKEYYKDYIMERKAGRIAYIQSQ